MDNGIQVRKKTRATLVCVMLIVIIGMTALLYVFEPKSVPKPVSSTWTNESGVEPTKAQSSNAEKLSVAASDNSNPDRLAREAQGILEAGLRFLKGETETHSVSVELEGRTLTVDICFVPTDEFNRNNLSDSENLEFIGNLYSYLGSSDLDEATDTEFGIYAPRTHFVGEEFCN